jgi:PAS domain S-box-containing protein
MRKPARKPARRKGARSGRRTSPIRTTAHAKVQRQSSQWYKRAPKLQLIYDTAPVGLAFLTPDCRYVQINQRLTEICGISVAGHIGRSVRETVPQVADQVEQIVQAVIRKGKPVMGVEVHGQRADKRNADRVWITNWHPWRGSDGSIVGVNVVAEEITERKRAEAILAASERALRDSEARFRELADNISQFAWTADQSGRRYWFNKRWYDYTGTTLEGMEGLGWQKVHHPEHVERVVQNIRSSFESGTPWEDTFPLRGRDGTYRWFLARALPIRNKTGEIVRWFGTDTDITQQVEAEKALRELNDNLETRIAAETRERLHIWNVSQDLLVVADEEGKYLSVNPAWTTSLGWSESDLLGRSSQWLLHPNDQEKTRIEIDHLAAGLKTRRFESRFRHKDGSYRWISWKAVPDRGRIYAMGRDVTELKDTENELRETRRELAQVGERATLAAMTAAIAHEIRQPLAAIVSNANAGLRWLSRTIPDFDEVRDTLRRIAADGLRAGEVTQRVSTGLTKGDGAGALLNVNEIIRETIALARAELDAARMIVELDLTEGLPLIPAHRGQLQQMMLNLLANAIDAMRGVDDRTRRLRVRSEASASHGIALSLEDNGTGIDPKNIDRIFDAFFTTKTNGIGMGLTICQSIVEAHNGSLSVSQTMPHGSIFHVVLPGQSTIHHRWRQSGKHLRVGLKRF